MCNKCNSCNKCENKCTCNPCTNCEKELLVQSVTLAGNTLLVVYNDGSQTQTNLQTQVLPLHVSNVVLSNNTLTTTFSNGTTTTSNVSIPNSVVSVGYNNNILTMTFLDGTTSNVGIPFNPNAFVNSTVTNNIITFIKQDGSNVNLTIPLPTQESLDLDIVSMTSTSASNVAANGDYIITDFTSEYVTYKKLEAKGYIDSFRRSINLSFKIKCQGSDAGTIFDTILALSDVSNSTLVLRTTLPTLPLYEVNNSGVITLTYSKEDVVRNSTEFEPEFSVINLPANIKLKVDGTLEIVFSIFKSTVDDLVALNGIGTHEMISNPVINGSFNLNYLY